MIDIIVPVYNEGSNIQALLDSLLLKVTCCQFTVIIIYDMPEDTTLPIISQIKQKYPYRIRLEKNHYGRGFGNAVRTGIESAENDYWVMTMADLSDSIETINQMYRTICMGYDMVVGSRYMTGGQKNGGPFLQSLFSRCASWGMHFLLGIPVQDISNAFRMYRKSSAAKIVLQDTAGADILVEILLKAYLQHQKIVEVPAAWFDRKEGTSHFAMWKLIPKYLYWCIFALKEKMINKR